MVKEPVGRIERNTTLTCYAAGTLTGKDTGNIVCLVARKTGGGAFVNDDILLRFLGKNLIDVGGDDTKLASLRQTANDLSSILKKAPRKATAFALVAFDPNVQKEDPVIAEAAGVLQKRWETYVNTFAETPITIFRAMLLDALTKTALENDAVAVAFVASARNTLPLMDVGEEREIWSDVVGEVEGKMEERAEDEWATPASITLPQIKIDPPPPVRMYISGLKVETDRLSKKFQAAAGPQAQDPQRGTVSTQGNQYWPHHNDPWVFEFGQRAASAVGEAITRTMEETTVKGGDPRGMTESLLATISRHLTETVQAVSSATAGLQRRTNLLWWKEAMFSPSIRTSYRSIPSSIAATLMAFDMHRQVPTLSPASVAAFLREAVIALPTIDSTQKTAIRALVKETRDADVLADLRKEAGNLTVAPSGRGPLLALIGHGDVLPQIDDRKFRDLVGVKPDTALTLPDWSVWIFLELQAARAATETAAPKRRTSRKKVPRK